MPKKKSIGNYTVIVECAMRRRVHCENCTEEQARANPFDHAADEVDLEVTDYEVKSVERDE